MNHLTPTTAEQQLDLLPNGICVIDRDLNILKWNATLVDWFGLSADEAVGANLLDLYSNLASKRFLPRIQRVFESGQPALFAPSTLHPFLSTSESHGKNNHRQLLKTVIRPLGDPGHCAQLCFTEVTTQYDQIQELRNEKELHKVSQKRAEAADQLKSEFLANMSHELRTPLNSLLILAQVLAENHEGNLTDKQVEMAEVIYGGGKELLSLINDILDLSKVEAGRLDLNFQDESLEVLLNSLQVQFNPVAQQQELELKIELLEKLPLVLCTDRQRLEQILRNLLSNAFKFTKQGSVTLRFHHPDPEVPFQNTNLKPSNTIAMSVLDTGIGIPANKQKEIFKAFQQGDGSISREYGGTGLGLTISREMAQLLGGELQVSSREGEGSTFTLYLPLEHEAGAVSSSISAHPLNETLNSI